MKTTQYLQAVSCSHQSLFSMIQSESERFFVLKSFLTRMSRQCRENAEKLNRPYKAEDLSSLRATLEEMFQQALLLYEAKWFGTDWRMDEKKQEDHTLFTRFLDWFIPFLEGARVYRDNVPTHLLFDEDEEEPLLLEDECHLILEKGGNYHGLCFKFSRTQLGMKGRSIDKRIDSMLPFVVNKCSLEKEYRHIMITPVYLETGLEKGTLAPWQISESTKSNVFFLGYEDCYEEGKFLMSVCRAKAYASIKSLTANCDLCSYAQYCKMQRNSQKRAAVTKETSGDYVMPVFDESQQQIVNFGKGTLLCCAGPGSGKTASLVGRVWQLWQKGVYPEFMLLISFTEKAAAELRERISTFLKEDDMPKICTLNALGYEIIRQADRKTKLSHKLLTDSGKQRIVTNLLNALSKPLSGVSYRQFSGGRYSTVAMVTRYLGQFETNPEEFYSKNPAIDPDEWEELYKLYKQTLSIEGYISYDEQITLAVEILKDPRYQDIQQYFHTIYQYIMVDEFQDINSPQNELISLLAKGNGNLVCIGDDDQAIYAWRGGSSYYMEHFKDTYPSASMVKLEHNYRSTKNIVGLCNEILKDSTERISKEMVITSNMEEGDKSLLINDNSIGAVADSIEKALNKGFKFKDIAIISTRNEDLEMLHEELLYPTTLASAYLRHDFLFNVIYYALGIALDLSSGFNPYAALGILLDMPKDWFREAGLAVSAGSVLTDTVFDIIQLVKDLSDQEIPRFIRRISVHLDMDDSISETTLLQYVMQGDLSNLKDLYFYMQDMIEFMDEKKIEYPADNNITLITAHSAKGKEYPCVIMYDADTYKGHIARSDVDASQDRRLLYVTASRAQRMLYVLKEKGSACLLDDSLYVSKAI